MQFERVRLENFKCFEDADLRLEHGVTVIHGLNGSGKSSLLEACFFSLYGARALEKTLDDVVTIGADEATIELWFSHGGGSYHIKRRIRATGERATTAQCLLETPDGSFEGARDVRAHIAELLRMDAGAFVNCAYVRQGEVNKLINATPADRQNMIDDLLQLGKLEEYRDRASNARLGVKHVRDGKREVLGDLDDQIERKESKDLHARLNELQTRLGEIDEEIERYEENRANAVETRDDAQSILDEYEQKRDRLDELVEEIETLTDTIQETDQEREQLSEQIRERKDHLESQREQRDELLAEADLDSAAPEAIDEMIVSLKDDDENLRSAIEEHRLAAQEQAGEAESLRETAADLTQRASDKRERASDLEREVAKERAKLEDRRAKIETLETEIETKRAVFDDEPVDVGEADDHCDTVVDELNEVREREAELETELDNEQASLREAEALIDAGKCPECGQPVEDSPHVESIDEIRERIAKLQDELVTVRTQREQLEEKLERADELVDTENELDQLRTNLDNVEQLVAEQEATVDEKTSQITDLREDAKELAREAEAKHEAADEAETKAQTEREQIGECNSERSTLQDRIDHLETLQETVTTIGDIEDELERLRDKRSDMAELNDERRGRLADKREHKAELQAEVDESAIEQAREEKTRATEYIEKVDPKLEALHEERDDVTSRIGGVNQEIEELEQLRERRDELAVTVDHLESLYDEAEQLQEMYGTLRAELRQRNVETLERMLNETFDLIYQNDSYSRIELNGEYELTVYQKDGEPLDPEQLSGGERALFNLSLRCAIYRLLAEGIEGSAPMPPLILDEPTVFLDSGHVSQLVELVEAMRELGVEQIVVVSHDEELVGAADDLVMVRKDATSNRSTVEREAADPDALVVPSG